MPTGFVLVDQLQQRRQQIDQRNRNKRNILPYSGTIHPGLNKHSTLHPSAGS